MSSYARQIVFAAVMFAAVAVPRHADGRQADHRQPDSSTPRIIQLGQRVTVRFSNASLRDVLTFLAMQTGMRADLTALSADRPTTVSIELVNVTLRTALNAICESANCSWGVEGSPPTLRASPLASIGAMPEFPATVSFHIANSQLHEVLKAFAKMITARVVIEPTVPNHRVSINLTTTNTTLVLDTLCEIGGCAWEYDRQNGELRIRRR